MDDAPLPSILTKNEEISKSFEIKQEENNFKLNIESFNQDINLTLLGEKDNKRIWNEAYIRGNKIHP